MLGVSDKLVFASGSKTLVALSSDQASLFAINNNQLTKVLLLEKPEDEPDILETCQSPTSISSSREEILVTSVNGDIFQYTKDGISNLLFRSVLPLRDCAVIHSGKACIVGGDDLELTIIELESHKKDTLKLDEQVSQLSYNAQMNILAVTLVNGVIDFYSLTSMAPNKIKSLESYAVANFYTDELEDAEFSDENRICTRVSWHPRGLKFAIPCKDYTVKIFNLSDFSSTKTLKSPNDSYFTNLLFDPYQGRYLAATDLANRLFVWDVNSGNLHCSKDLDFKLSNMCWRLHNDQLELLFGTWNGEVVTVRPIAGVDYFIKHKSVTEDEITSKPKNALFLESDDENTSHVSTPSSVDNDRRELIPSENMFTDIEDGEKSGEGYKRTYNFEDEEQFIDDDDNAGYITKKPKTKDHYVASSHKYSKYRQKPYKFNYRPISPGGTPFGSTDKRYLTMNSIGYIWTVRGNVEQYTVTVSFFDVGRYREYHFEDLFGYDACSLTEEGTLFAQSKTGQLMYRPHDSFKDTKWVTKIPLSPNESITAVAATPTRMLVATSFGYFRTFNEFGVPLSLEKMTPIVALAAQGHKVFTVHYSTYQGLSYSLFEQNPQAGNRFYQRESQLPIELPSFNNETHASADETFNEFNPLGIRSIFFSNFGDPCIFGQDGVLLVLSKWRNTMESRWIPLVDTNLEIWKLSGGKQPDDVHVWPLGLNYDTMYYILIKGKHIWPEFPLPLPSEMEIRIPVLDKSLALRDENLEDEEVVVPTVLAAEEEFLRSKVLSELLSDTLEHDGELYGNENEILQSLAGVRDKSLLRLFAAACSDQHSDKALSLLREIKQDKALTAAIKIAERAELMNLVKKINDLREARFEIQYNKL
ncbi:chromatin-binding protein CTF4 Ecym_4434 [Eremothecium cymbalariae DBVPG|uniref:Uncharacterized protein n=1 Tax=Eremothecium cymbalariae (strain CBS 270.75 / DBVPG 7215 / KCTC 17166 / NRRL Y-17582) TaxID=931890 RepID=G8JTX7_ERECY|nr:hypothetical protein Ecym_4434 [Eremothecium cymbalariae DBVPG\